MKITTRGSEVRIFPEDRAEFEAVDVVAMTQRRGIHVNRGEKFLFFQMPHDRDLLYEALKIIVGQRQAQRLTVAVQN